MALAKKNSNSNRFIIIALVVVVVGGVGYLLFKQFFLDPKEELNQALNANRGKAVITEFGESILNDPRFTSLKSFDVTVNADAETDGGQVNPFQ